MVSARTLSLAVVPLALHALAREVDRALGLVLRAEVEPAGLLVELARALDAAGLAPLLRVGSWLVAGLGVVVLLAWWQWHTSSGGTRATGTHAAEAGTGDAAASLDAAFAREALALAPLLLRPGITLLALVSVAVQPAFPYAFTLPVALTQDWGIAQDLLALAAVLALRLPALRIPPPRAAEVFLLSFVAYAALVPAWAWHWDSHPGNEPKTLRQAVALGHWLTFDAEAVTGPMEELETQPLDLSLPGAAAVVASESWRMLDALARGEAGADAIGATRIARQVIRGKQGGVYSVLAPGPSLLLAPALRADRAVNRSRGESGRVAVSVLLFCALGAWLVTAVFWLVRDATDRAGLATALALGFAVVPPFVFYFHQFYPEMLGAIVLALAFRTIALRPERIRLDPWRLGALVAVLPWLHQKFLPVWGVLLATALLVRWRSPAARGLDRSGWKWAARVLAPNVVSLYLFALYNFAVTGSVRPDGLFLAWGPRGVSSERIGQGVLGLLLDARFGVLPYVPLLLLAGAGLALGGARRFAVILPAAAAYYLTVASADNWSGAVCNLGRYVMPLAPLGVALVGIAIARVDSRRGAMTLVLSLASWTALLALALRQDPHAANDSALLLAKSTYADGLQYIPSLFIRTWADAVPGLGLRIAAWLFLAAAAAFWLRRAATSQAGAGRSPIPALAGIAATLLLVGLALERMTPTTRTSPAWPSAMALDDEGTVFLKGASVVREDEAIVGPGAVEILVRAPVSRSAIVVTLGGGGGFAQVAGRPPHALRPTGALVEVPLSAYHEVRGRDRNAAFSRGYMWLDEEAVLRPMRMELGASEVR